MNQTTSAASTSLDVRRIDPRSRKEYDHHYKVFEVRDDAVGLHGFIAIHRMNPGVPSFGATRLWTYGDSDQALDDALRLSRTMSHKSAVAGLPCGGAKAALVWHPGVADRAAYLHSYAAAVDRLGGEFVTGTDVGLSQEDLSTLRQVTPHVVGFTDHSTECTAAGVFEGICASLMAAYNDPSIDGRSFAVQGLGKIGGSMLRRLCGHASAIVVATDTDQEKIAAFGESCPDVRFVSPEEIHRQEVDVFSPCALAHPVNARSVEELKCRVVAGGANNQLEMEALGVALMEQWIVYAPDFVINAGGLISVYDEYEHPGDDDVKRALEKINRIPEVLGDIFVKSKSRGLPTNAVANAMAHRIFDFYLDADAS